MIGLINGTLIEKQPPLLILDVHGVGYEIAAPMTTFYHLPDINQSITLHTHFAVREDAHTLFGFFKKSDRDLFRCLIKVNGVGPKLALTILSSIDSLQFVLCIDQRDIVRLTNIPGIGKKTAERLLIEMRDALNKWHRPQHSALSSESTLPQNQKIEDAIDALIALGYKNTEAKQAIDRIYAADLKTEQLIRAALKSMNKGTVNG